MFVTVPAWSSCSNVYEVHEFFSTRDLVTDFLEVLNVVVKLVLALTPATKALAHRDVVLLQAGVSNVFSRKFPVENATLCVVETAHIVEYFH